MGDWKVQSRLTVLLLATVALVGLGGTWLLYGFGHAVDAIGTIYRDRVVPVQQLHSIESAYRREAADTLALWRGGMIGPADTAARFAAEARDMAGLLRLEAGELKPAVESLEGTLDRLIDVQRDVARDEAEQAPRAYRQAALVSAGLLMLLLAVCIGLAAWVIARHLREQRAADARTARMESFYRALSRTNQLIIRSPSERVLFEELCRICVETGHALVARIDRLEGTSATRVATAGPAADALSGLAEHWDVTAPDHSGSLVGRVLGSGGEAISNDYQADPRSLAYQAVAQRGGIRSGAAFALQRGGRVVGSVALFAAEPNFFDPPLVELIRELAQDVSFALDRIDRDEEIHSLNLQLEDRVRERTEQLQSLVRELERSRDEAHAATHAKGEFLANMSHEIRTPINAVLGLTDLTLRTQLDERQRNYVSKTHLAADALLQLLNRVLDFSKIEAQRLELEAAPFDLSMLLDQVSAIVAEKAQNNGLALHIVTSPELPPQLVGDAQRLRQVLVNLCSNAVKFTRSGEVVVQVQPAHRASADTGRCALRVSVRDTGIGMTEDQVTRLFQPFMQADVSTSREYGGTGLGLAISKQLVELMGGRIEVSSRLGEGSEFSFTVEMARAGARSAADLDDRTAVVAAGSPLEQLHGRRVLVIDDNELNQIVAGDLLREVAGMHVVLASSGPEALEAVQRERFDVVLCDVQMPGMDGYEVTRRLRDMPALADLPIVALTAHASTRDQDLCRVAGMNEYLTKPFDPQQLFRVIASVLGPAGQAPHAPAISLAARSGVLIQLGLDRCLGRRELYDKIAARFVKDKSGLPAEMSSLLAAGHVEQAATLAHNLISTAGTLGALALSNLARRLQEEFDARRAEHYPPLLQELSAEHPHVIATLIAHLGVSAAAAEQRVRDVAA